MNFLGEVEDTIQMFWTAVAVFSKTVAVAETMIGPQVNQLLRGSAVISIHSSDGIYEPYP